MKRKWLGIALALAITSPVHAKDCSENTHLSEAMGIVVYAGKELKTYRSVLNALGLKAGQEVTTLQALTITNRAADITLASLEKISLCLEALYPSKK